MEISIRIDTATGQKYMAVSQKGMAVLLDPLTNKGTAFTNRERDELDLHGLMPPIVSTMRQQLDRTYENFEAKTTNLERFTLNRLRATIYKQTAVRARDVSAEFRLPRLDTHNAVEDTSLQRVSRRHARFNQRIAMKYSKSIIPEGEIPAASAPQFQHILDTYASETNKTYSTWMLFSNEDLAFRPHPRSGSVEEIMKHQLLSERRFFSEFLELPEPAAASVLPAETTPPAFGRRLVELVQPRLKFMALRDAGWWLERRPFFDVEKERIWIFWRRVLHSAHHRTQLTVFLRLMGKLVPSTYGPTADVTWSGADPTLTVDAGSRKSRQ